MSPIEPQSYRDKKHVRDFQIFIQNQQINSAPKPMFEPTHITIHALQYKDISHSKFQISGHRRANFLLENVESEKEGKKWIPNIPMFINTFFFTNFLGKINFCVS